MTISKAGDERLRAGKSQQPIWRRRRGGTNTAVLILLAAILIALIGLIVVLATQGKAPANTNQQAPSEAQPNTVVTRDQLSNPPPKPKSSANPDRIKESVQAGKTYRTTVKTGFQCRVEDKDWGLNTVTNLIFVAEFVVERQIESNDGNRIVELRKFETARCAKFLTELEGVDYDLGTGGSLLLIGMESIVPGTIESLVVTKPIFQAALRYVGQREFDESSVKGRAQIDGLTGKTVRIVYENGKGVVELTPINCTLSEDEKYMLFSTAVVSDCYVMPDVQIKVGGTWSVDGAEFAGYFSSWKGIPSGIVTVVREADQNKAGKSLASLRVDKGVIDLNGSDRNTSRVGRLTPNGRLHYSLDERFIQSATFHGDMIVETCSKDHILFEAKFKSRPKLDILYECQMK